MKSEIVSEITDKELKFPCLMKSKNKGYVILATSLKGGSFSGTIVFEAEGEDNSEFKIGVHSNNWGCLQYFKPFSGTIQISNT